MLLILCKFSPPSNRHVQCTLLSVNLSKAVVAHLVHEAVEQRGGALLVDTELSLRGVVVMLLDVAAPVCGASDTHHPQELVDVWTHNAGSTIKTEININEWCLRFMIMYGILGEDNLKLFRGQNK